MKQPQLYLKPEGMVEVFKTNVHERHYAAMLLERIHNAFVHYAANFDLEDCDRILRVKSANGAVPPQEIIELLQQHGFEASVLPDEIPQPRLMPGEVTSWPPMQ